MDLTGNLGQLVCAFNSCAEKPISMLCANKEGEESIYETACACHEPQIFEDMKELYMPMGYAITILDISEGSR